MNLSFWVLHEENATGISNMTGGVIQADAPMSAAVQTICIPVSTTPSSTQSLFGERVAKSSVTQSNKKVNIFEKFMLSCRICSSISVAQNNIWQWKVVNCYQCSKEVFEVRASSDGFGFHTGIGTF